MALVGALWLTLNAGLGFTNRRLQAQVSRLLGQDYGINQMSYDGLGEVQADSVRTAGGLRGGAHWPARRTQAVESLPHGACAINSENLFARKL